MSRISANLRKNKQNKKGEFYLKKSSSHFFRKSKRNQILKDEADRTNNYRTFSRLHKNFMSKQNFNSKEKKQETMLKLKKTKSHSSGFNQILSNYNKTEKRSGLKIKNLKSFLAKKPKLSIKKSSSHVRFPLELTPAKVH